MRISDWSSDVCSSDLGHAIGGLTINRPSADYVGLFGFQGGGTISRTGVIGVSVIGDQDVGGLVGHQVGGSIGQSYATGRVTGDHYVGGLRSEERRVGKEWGSTCRSRWSLDHIKQKIQETQ